MFGLLRSQLQVFVSKAFERNMAFYAVAKGRKVGIYANWTQCEQQVKGFKGAIYKKFNTRQKAEEFIKQINKSTDFWPEDMADKEGTEDDLIATMNEVEGFPASSSSLKRRTDANNTQSSKSKIPRHASRVEEAIALKHFGAFEFVIDSEGYVIVYTDGSCLGNGRANACAGFGVYFGENHQLNAAKPVMGRVTNNVGEIQASIYAIKTALDLGINKLCISTDSQFLINSITLWVPGWKRRGWRLKNNDPVKNVDDFKELDQLLQSKDIKVKWNYVEAHKGIYGNEMADKLAKQGSQMYRELNCK